MSLGRMPLRKLLQLMYANESLRISKLREDIRNDIGRESGQDVGGPDFFSPFWRSAKNHVFGLGDLSSAVEEHIRANPRRRNLYPRLRDGFLLWWNERRRWTNQPFTETQAIRGSYVNARLDVTARVDNVLCVRDGMNEDHFIYPYFSEQPVLPEQGARLGLWILSETFPHIPANELRVLDVIRGVNHSMESAPLRGDERSIFEGRMEALLSEWGRLRLEYD